MMRRVVPLSSLFTISLFFALAALPVPSAVACDTRDCYNELYTASGASFVGIDIDPLPFVCVVEPCGNGGVGLNGARTESHGEYTYVVASGADWVFGKAVPLGLCGEAVPGECVAYAEVDCGANTIWGNDVPFHNVTYFIPSLAVTSSLQVCLGSAGLVTAVFANVAV